jgi:hypothetical protein
MVGDGKETEWDDVLGDGLLGDVMLAQDNANRGLLPESEDKMLIGRCGANYNYRPRPAISTDGAWGVIVVLLGLGLMACLCYMSMMSGACEFR